MSEISKRVYVGEDYDDFSNKVYLDGEILKYSMANGAVSLNPEKGEVGLYINSLDDLNLLRGVKEAEYDIFTEKDFENPVRLKFGDISVSTEESRDIGESGIDISVSYIFRDRRFYISFSRNTETWGHGISFIEFGDALNLEVDCILGGRYERANNWSYLAGNGFVCPAESIMEIMEGAVLAERNVSERLGINKSRKSITIPLEFPEEIKEACHQYLMYFGKFLKDVGEGVSLKIEERGRRTLFSVMPHNQDIALENLYEALAIYFATATSSPSTVSGQSLAEQRWQAVAGGFQAQVAIAQAEIYARDIAIRTQTTTIEAQYSEIQRLGGVINQQGLQIQALSGQLGQSLDLSKALTDALKKSQEDESGDPVKLFGGVLEVGKHELGPINVNFGEALRMVKKLFSETKEDERCNALKERNE